MISLDFLGRSLLAVSFSVFLVFHSFILFNVITADELSETYILDLIGRIAGLIFMVLAIGLTIFRLPPKSISLGWGPRIAAIAGTFMTSTTVVLPQVSLPIELKYLATSLTVIGTTLSVICLGWLGRSFSIDAQARRLVTGGPYNLVRHPLYVSEAIMLVGTAILNWSVWSFSLLVANLLLQYWRIRNEETVLRQAFPEYGEYTRNVPQLIPRLRIAAGHRHASGKSDVRSGLRPN